MVICTQASLSASKDRSRKVWQNVGCICCEHCELLLKLCQCCEFVIWLAWALAFTKLWGPGGSTAAATTAELSWGWGQEEEVSSGSASPPPIPPTSEQYESRGFNHSLCCSTVELRAHVTYGAQPKGHVSAAPSLVSWICPCLSEPLNCQAYWLNLYKILTEVLKTKVYLGIKFHLPYSHKKWEFCLRKVPWVWWRQVTSASIYLYLIFDAAGKTKHNKTKHWAFRAGIFKDCKYDGYLLDWHMRDWTKVLQS